MKNPILLSHRNIAIAATAMMLAGVASSAGAQARSSRWSAWTGCWSSTIAGLSQVEIENLPTVCVSPTSNLDVVEIATISKGQIVGRDTIDASGVPRMINARDCSGTKSATWSKDDRRVYLRSSISCGNNHTSVSSIIAMNDLGQWLDVRGVSSGDAENVRVARYRPVEFPEVVRAQMPVDMRDLLSAAQGSRLAAGAPIGTSAIVEASKLADSAVVEAWILERNQKLTIDANLLIQFADAGVPSSVTDAIVAVSNPGEFAISQVDPGTVARREDDGHRVVIVTAEPVCSPASLSYYAPYSYGSLAYDSGYGCGYSTYRNGYYGYGLGSGYYGPGYGAYRNAPIVIVPGTVVIDGNGAGAGVAIKGRGYTQPGTSSGGTTTARTSNPSNAPSSSSSGSSSSGSSASQAPAAPPAQPAQTETRTAKPRP